nr:hypothetical protein BaRGS_017594 [Batillaria attramentaria]
MDPRVKHRDPSPGGLGRLSTSAPSEDAFYWGPGRSYTMRLMNLGRWSTRNKTVTEAVSAVRVTLENKQEASTQTDITMESMLVTIPRSLLQETPPPGGERGHMRRNSSSLVDRMVHRALSMDSLSTSYYIPRQHVGWRSYVAMLGMHILQQVIHT